MRKSRQDKVVLDDFDNGVIRGTIHELLVYQKRLPGIKVLMEELTSKIDFKGGRACLRISLHKLGFRCKKNQEQQKCCHRKKRHDCCENTERSDVIAARLQFLRNIKKFQEEERQNIYTDATYVHSSHSVHRSWQSSDVSLQVPFSRGERFIVVHTGTDTGLIGGAALFFKAHSATGDYHKEMNSKARKIRFSPR